MNRKNGMNGKGRPLHERPCATASHDAMDDAVVGNFLMGDWLGDVKCRYGHETRLFNIGRGHFVACDRCRTFLFVGSNLTSGWRQESESIWRKNSKSVKGYRLVE